jgi:biopolymer transport protein ExbD
MNMTGGRGRRRRRGSEAGVDLSPLIDCVFLLLIFFLVTRMLKRFERQIPINLADASATVGVTADPAATIIGIDAAGNVYLPDGRGRRGSLRFKQVPDGDVLRTLSDLRTASDGRPVELQVETETPFQTVIDVVDLLEDLGFDNVRSRTRESSLSFLPSRYLDDALVTGGVRCA